MVQKHETGNCEHCGLRKIVEPVLSQHSMNQNQEIQAQRNKYMSEYSLTHLQRVNSEDVAVEGFFFFF